ncbi:Radical SAM family enzyme, similar to coproporphyrinogen III oxidase, oxygen-independent, clustered with nucleoside-triphosphatase RdgB [hydrothermal vent metagenome]|uniref:Radical SAM family enzyme, similar to coproporphyrinogen III oxidase, oxygen-independent, clustered with nucleoside-triphosphatase RdgB n=1 Tax=hydrothermal vent metagenome TaxID=652676 RepID=A0A3B0WWN7_9ZZZZ
MPEFSTLPPLSLYLHIPWCVKKCPYCDFNSHTFESGLPEEQYINSLIADLETQLPTVWGRRIISVFIGGGTPSLFSGESIHKVMSTIRSHLTCLPNMEVTMEANPGSVEQEKFNAFYQAGVNRLSIGVQSFDDDKLQALGRIHNASEAINAVAVARKAGFENINLDLMFGLPGNMGRQSVAQALSDLQQAIDLAPQHISWYQMTIEPNTFFYSHPPITPEEDELWEMQLQGQRLLASAGYEQYEISAYARQSLRCSHNVNYWQFGDYLAIGAGAHGKISRADMGEINRYWQVRKPDDYMQASATDKTSGIELLTEQQIVFEFMLNALRLKQGFDIETFEQHTGLKHEMIREKCQQAMDKGLLQKQGNDYAATQQGYLFLNDLINHFSVA